jgi:signal transduction histidine kinase
MQLMMRGYLIGSRPDAPLALVRGAPTPALMLVTCDDAAAAMRCAAAGNKADFALFYLGRFDAARQLADLERLTVAMPHLPVVALGGAGDEALPIGALQAGAEDYLVSDATLPAVLPQAIHRAIERHRAATRRARAGARRLAALVRRAVLDWQLAFDVIETPVVIVDSYGRIRRINRGASELAHRRPLRALEQLGDRNPWRTAIDMVPFIHRSLRSMSRQTTDEMGRSWQVKASLIEHPEPRADEVFLMLFDVSQVVALEASLRGSRAMAAMGALVAGVAHGVRNPLFGISATVDAFDAHLGRRPEHARYIAALRHEVAALNKLMRNLLDYGRPRRSSPVPALLNHAIRDAISSLHALAGQRRVRFSFRGEETPVSMPMDRGRITELFQNLLENAALYSPAGSVVGIEVHLRESWIECAVLDKGPGFASDDLPHIFDPFFSRRAGGTGLGLAIAQRIVEEHEGKIAASNRPHGGARVSVCFPV